MGDSATLIAALSDAIVAGSDRADQPTILQTHLSWVILAGQDAWKIKKPVKLDFVDFSTLENRRLACEKELLLNRRYSPELYLGVVPITGSEQTPCLVLPGTPGPIAEPIEYAVHMRRFNQATIFSAMIANGKLDAEAIDELATLIADLHKTAIRSEQPSESEPLGPDPAPEQAGSPMIVEQQILQAFDGVAEQVTDGRLRAIRQRLSESLDRSNETLLMRRTQGFVRECHADLHLANICCYQGAVTVFDCLEFDPLLRVIDVMADLAFVVSDLSAWGRSDLASRLLNQYLFNTGDYAGLKVLRLYVAYRALVRARVQLLSPAGSSQDKPAPTGSAARLPKTLPSVDDYIGVADKILKAKIPTLVILHGLSGSGKSWLADQLCSREELIHLRSDIERKRLLGLSALATSTPLSADTALGEGAYTPQHSRMTYAQLVQQAAQAISAGYSVIVDATFQQRADRMQFADLARSLACNFLILDIQADEQVMRKRIRERLIKGTDPSEANEQVLELQLTTRQRLDADEIRASLRFDNSRQRDAHALDQALAPIINAIFSPQETGATSDS